MSSNTQYNRHKRLVANMASLLDDWQRYQWSNAEYLARRSALYQGNDYQRATIATREFLRGMESYAMGAIWRALVYSYVVNGERLSIESAEYRAVSPQYVSEHCLESGAHIWRTSGKLFDAPQLPQNLDGLNPSELLAIALDTGNPAEFREYAETKSRAMECRAAGKIGEALELERTCERIYKALPAALQW
jgi:hypothetical protein